jgi:hypothetical protein
VFVPSLEFGDGSSVSADADLRPSPDVDPGDTASLSRRSGVNSGVANEGPLTTGCALQATLKHWLGQEQVGRLQVFRHVHLGSPEIQILEQDFELVTPMPQRIHGISHHPLEVVMP